MGWKFWKKPEERKPEEETPLQKACRELGREDLYKLLSSILPEDPRALDKELRAVEEGSKKPEESFLFRGGGFASSQLAIVRLYRKDYEKSRHYFQEALNNQYKPDNINLILKNFDDAIRIAERSWEERGVYKKPEKKS